MGRNQLENEKFNNQTNNFMQSLEPEQPSKQSSSKQQVIECALCIICVAWIILDAVFNDKLFEWNYSFTKSLQNGDSDPSIAKYKIFTIISYLGQEELIAAFVLIGFMFFANKIQALKILVGTMITVCLISFLKLWYKDPRPYFVYYDLQGIGCDPEFGKPSGHALITSVLFYLMFDSFLNNKMTQAPQQQDQQDKEQYKETKVIDIEMLQQDQNNSPQISSLGSPTNQSYQEIFLNSSIYLPTYLVLMFLVGFSRIILGAHSFNQVLLGWAYGILYIIFYRKKLDKLIENSLLTVVNKIFENQQQKIRYFIMINVIYVLILGLSMLFYYLADNSLTKAQKIQYKANFMSHSYCEDSFEKHKFLAGDCLLTCAVISLVYAVYISCLSLNGTYQPELWNQIYKDLSLTKKILRVVTTLVLVAIPYVLFSLYKIDNQYLYFIFRSNLKYFFVGIFLIRIQPFIYKITKLEIEGDLLKILPNQGFFG